MQTAQFRDREQMPLRPGGPPGAVRTPRERLERGRVRRVVGIEPAIQGRATDAEAPTRGRDAPTVREVPLHGPAAPSCRELPLHVPIVADQVVGNKWGKRSATS